MNVRYVIKRLPKNSISPLTCGLTRANGRLPAQLVIKRLTEKIFSPLTCELTPANGPLPVHIVIKRLPTNRISPGTCVRTPASAHLPAQSARKHLTENIFSPGTCIRTPAQASPTRGQNKSTNDKQAHRIRLVMECEENHILSNTFGKSIISRYIDTFISTTFQSSKIYLCIF